MTIRDELGPLSESELKVILAKTSWDLAHSYHEIVTRYRNTTEFADALSREEPGKAAQIADRDRNKLHHQLRQIAQALRKSDKELFADILGRSKNLESYGLSEFEMVTRDDLEDNRMFERETAYENVEEGVAETLEDEMEEMDFVGRIEEIPYYNMTSDLRKGEIGIIFARRIQTAIRMPDPKLITSRGNLIAMETRTSREASRRGIRLAQKFGAKFLSYQYFSHEFVQETHAVVVNQDSIDKITGYLREHRSEFGIREEDIPEEIKEADWKAYEEYVNTELKERFPQKDEIGKYLFSQAWKNIFDRNASYLSQEELLSEVKKMEKRERNFPKEGFVSTK